MTLRQNLVLLHVPFSSLVVRSVSVLFKMAFFTSLKVANIANVTFTSCLHPAAINVANLLLAESLKPCQPAGIRIVSGASCVPKSWLIVVLYAIKIVPYATSAMRRLKLK